MPLKLYKICNINFYRTQASWSDLCVWLSVIESETLASGKLRVSPRIERARVICQRPRKNFGKERAFGARASWVNDARICGNNFLWEMTRARHLSKSQKKFRERTRIRRASKFSKFFKIFNFRVFKFSKLSKILKFSNVEIF